MKIPRGSAIASRRAAVHAIAQDVVPIKDDVANVYSDTKFDTLLLRYRRIAFDDPVLNFDSTPYATLANSTSMPSLVVFTIRPRCCLIFGSTRARQWAFS
jgi:hypothetical protein